MIESRASYIFKNILLTGCFSQKASPTEQTTSTAALDYGKRSYWYGLIICSFARKDVSLLNFNFSSILEEVDNTDIGL